MDENYLVLIFLTLSVGLELVVWLVPHIVGDAVAVCFVGFLLGPLLVPTPPPTQLRCVQIEFG